MRKLKKKKISPNLLLLSKNPTPSLLPNQRVNLIIHQEFLPELFTSSMKTKETLSIWKMLSIMLPMNPLALTLPTVMQLAVALPLQDATEMRGAPSLLAAMAAKCATQLILLNSTFRITTTTTCQAVRAEDTTSADESALFPLRLFEETNATKRQAYT